MNTPESSSQLSQLMKEVEYYNTLLKQQQLVASGSMDYVGSEFSSSANAAIVLIKSHIHAIELDIASTE